jgi:hypothetical protein
MMKNYLLATFLLSSSLSTVLASHQTNLWTEEQKEKMDLLSTQYKFIGDINSIKTLQFDSFLNGFSASKALSLVFMESTKGSFVLKETLYHSEFKREQDLVKDLSVKNWQDILNKARTADGKSIILTQYHAAYEKEILNKVHYFTLMDKAEGETLLHFATKLNNSELNMTEEEAVAMGTHIGQQMAAATKAFFLENKSLLVHGDVGAQNFMYDPKANQLYWIDLGGTHVFKNHQSPWENYYDYETNMVKSFWWNFFPFHHRNEYESLWDTQKQEKTSLKEKVAQEGLTALKNHRLGILIGDAFYGAYKSAVSELETAKEWNTHPDAFPKFIEERTNDYKDAVQRVFSAEKAKDVLNYLFAPAAKDTPVNPSPSLISVAPEDKKEEQAKKEVKPQKVPTLNQILNAFVQDKSKNLYQQVLEGRRYSLKEDPFVASIEHLGFQMTTTNPTQALRNTAILNNPLAKNHLQESINQFVENSADQIVKDLKPSLGKPSLSEDLKENILSHIKDQLFFTVYQNLWDNSTTVGRRN